MFHAFKCDPPSTPLAGDTSRSSQRTRRASSSRITTTNACSECRRRKIGCDGHTPCKQCLWYKHPDLCSYTKPRQRIVPSHKVLQNLSTSLEQSQGVLKTLFPTRDVQFLARLSRDDLIGLLASSDSLSNSSPALSQDTQPPKPYSPDHGRNLQSLEEAPSQDAGWDESRRKQEPISQVSDDVNALSLTLDRQCSYVGVSSIKAALRVIHQISPPASRTFLAHPSGRGTRAPSPLYITSSSYGDSPGGYTLPGPSLKEQELIDAYFSYVHVIVSMIDEEHFRATYNGYKIKPPDDMWLALLNMVLALGTIAACKSDENSHTVYYNRAKELLGLDAFGSGRLEALQALILIGGYYLHYLNQPNQAHAIMGAAMRMALAMGLHREQSEKAITSSSEVRRRTWWTFFCMDTWASMTLGRPTLRWGPGITIRGIEYINSKNPSALSAAFHQIHVSDVQFCEIATNIQDRLAVSPLVEFSDMAMLDTKIVAWYENLRLPESASEPYTIPFLISRSIVRWRFYNLRIVLHRPVLLSVAMRGALQGSTSNPQTLEEIEVLSKCRDMANRTIEDVAISWQPNQMSGWNGAWFLFQACIVPLVSIFMDGQNPESDKWRQEVESALDSFDKMRDWSLAARRTREVVARVYQASKVASAPDTQIGMDLVGSQGFWDESIGGTFWDDMMWSFPDNLDLSLNGLDDFEASPNENLTGYSSSDNPNVSGFA